ncbi:VOC family protein [Planomicrobium sp. CPCC 101079]|uniref:VOC family protein n=1 Tax=Planomicrobium sp. CPCC 101079 TaxID=2599618 RepID=UPI0011B3E473|nr:VOC family protein [Planomicrobium sp. CPCC 101079]TWT02287.1 VOC family protein [Planomicrobium sp. CPCC 101079]
MYLDHIVHFIDGTPQEATDYWNRLGFAAVLGGQHLKWGTHNALFYVKDCYIEWLAIENHEIANRANHPLTELLLHDREGFGTVCLRTTEIEQLDKRLQKQGFETSGVLDAERRTNAGKLIRWKMLFIKEAISNQLPSPFFIQWQEPDEIRLENLRESGALQPENETLEIEECVFSVYDVAASTEKWTKLLGGVLELNNCRFKFRLANDGKERLEKVIFKASSQEVTFAEGVYWLPEKGNNKGN